ncbi:MAG: hypothetical protein LM558_05085 [Thermosphaera sp.]|nr:hypothetical protein [Thermosphaera sp.]
MITVVVYRDGRPVSGAHVIAIHKLGLGWVTAVTSPDGTAQLGTLPGSYFIVAGDDLGNGAWVDGVGDGELVIVNLVPKTNRRYFVDLELRLPVADPVARVLEALRPFYNKLLEVIGDLASRLGITTPVTELARTVRLGEVRAVGSSTVRIYFEVLGSPIPVALSIVAPIIAILILILAVFLVSRWAFGEELPVIVKTLAYGILIGGVASLLVAVTGFVRELRR